MLGHNSDLQKTSTEDFHAGYSLPEINPDLHYPVATKRTGGERGIALIMALFVLAILSLVGITYMTSSTLETRINFNSRSSYPVFYAAEAGLEEGTYRLKADAINPIALSLVDAPTKVVYIRQSSSIVPTDSSSPYYDAEYPSSNFSTVTYASTNQSTNLMPYQWVKISMKTKRLSGHDVDNTGLTTNQDVPVYYDGAEYLYSPPTINATKTGYRVYQVTAFATGTSGSGYKVRREISNLPPFPGLPGALTLNGPTPNFGTPNSNNYVIDGTDHAASPGAALPAIAVISNGDVTSVKSQLARPDHYTGSGGSGTPAGTGDVQNVSSSMPSAYTTVQGLEDMLTTLVALPGAIQNGTNTSSSNWGTIASPKINVFDGNCDLGNGSGAGVLIVRGNFSANGNYSFDGLIVIIGTGSASLSGGGNGHVDGGIFIAKTRDTVGGALRSTLGIPSINYSGGGGNGLRYDSAKVNNAFTNSNIFTKLAYKEMSQ